MKLLLQPVVSLLLTLLAKGKGRSYSETEDILRELSCKYKDFLLPVVGRNSQRQRGNWNETKRRTVGENIFRSLNPLFTVGGNYTVQKILSGMDCPASNESLAIVQLKVLRRVNCEKRTFKNKCIMNNPRRVYCSWIGTLKNDMPAKMLGALCFQSQTVSIQEELEMGRVDICGSWKYGDTDFYRLKVPKSKSSWLARFILYEPPVYDSSNKQPLRKNSLYVNGYTHPLNPGGRTGIAGNGMLRNMGENKMQMLMILRLNNSGATEHPAEPSAEEYFHAIVQPERKQFCSKERLKSIIDRSRKWFIYDRYLAHPNVTDNAWVKATVYVIKTEQQPCFDHLDLTQEGNYLNYQWKAERDSKTTECMQNREA